MDDLLKECEAAMLGYANEHGETKEEKQLAIGAWLAGAEWFRDRVNEIVGAELQDLSSGDS